jgi:hypothetical protein
MCPQAHGQIKKTIQENREKPAILKDKMRFATETSLAIQKADFRLKRSGTVNRFCFPIAQVDQQWLS